MERLEDDLSGEGVVKVLLQHLAAMGGEVGIRREGKEEVEVEVWNSDCVASCFRLRLSQQWKTLEMSPNVREDWVQMWSRMLCRA